MTRCAFFAAAAFAATLAGPAAAQVAGTYSGTSADGNGISFTVATDPNTGALAVTGASVGFSAPCKGNVGVTLNTGWGYGLLADISNGQVSNVSQSTYFDIAFNLTFSSDGQSATGQIETVSPDLYYVGDKAKKALLCTSKKQAMTLSLQNTAKAPPLPANFLLLAPGAHLLTR